MINYSIRTMYMAGWLLAVLFTPQLHTVKI